MTSRPLMSSGLQGADEVAQPDLAFPFVAVVAGLHQHVGSVAVLDAHDGDGIQP